MSPLKQYSFEKFEFRAAYVRCIQMIPPKSYLFPANFALAQWPMAKNQLYFSFALFSPPENIYFREARNEQKKNIAGFPRKTNGSVSVERVTGSVTYTLLKLDFSKSYIRKFKFCQWSASGFRQTIKDHIRVYKKFNWGLNCCIYLYITFICRLEQFKRLKELNTEIYYLKLCG